MLETFLPEKFKKPAQAFKQYYQKNAVISLPVFDTSQLIKASNVNLALVELKNPQRHK